MQKAALENPDRIFNAYIELAPGQFIELFPERKGQVRHEAPDGSEFGYAHFALTTEDIYQTRQELEARGVVFDHRHFQRPFRHIPDVDSRSGREPV